ncbi:MAG: HNH endonuclease [Armatimonadota bacterium]
MSISDRTRKILWARSGNRCAICRSELILDSESTNDPDAVVGDECHISAKSPGFARYDSSNDGSGGDRYDNLLLLCKTHHKQIDDQFDKFTVSFLHNLKARHENWVRLSLEKSRNGSKPMPNTDGITFLPRILTGKQLIDMLQIAQMYKFDYEPLDSDIEADLVASFLQDCQDYADILNDIGAGEVVQAGLTMQKQLDELEDNSFLVFGECKPQKYRFDFLDKVCDLQMITIIVLRESNPSIIK